MFNIFSKDIEFPRAMIGGLILEHLYTWHQVIFLPFRPFLPQKDLCKTTKQFTCHIQCTKQNPWKINATQIWPSKASHSFDRIARINDPFNKSPPNANWTKFIPKLPSNKEKEHATFQHTKPRVLHKKYSIENQKMKNIFYKTKSGRDPAHSQTLQETRWKKQRVLNR